MFRMLFNQNYKTMLKSDVHARKEADWNELLILPRTVSDMQPELCWELVEGHQKPLVNVPNIHIDQMFSQILLQV